MQHVAHLTFCVETTQECSHFSFQVDADVLQQDMDFVGWLIKVLSVRSIIKCIKQAAKAWHRHH